MAQKVRGKSFILRVVGSDSKKRTIGCGKNCEITITRDTEEATIAPTALWREYHSTRKGWSVTAEGFWVIDITSATELDSMTSGTELAKIVSNGTVLEIWFMTDGTAGENEPFKGKIKITSVKYSGNNGEISTYSFTAVGQGELSGDWFS